MAGSNIIINLDGGSELQNYIRKPDGSGFDNYAELKAFKSVGQEGDFALVTSTSSFWIWDINTGDWKNGDTGDGVPGPVSWSEVTGKPTTFQPSAHAHSISEVSGIESVLAGKAATEHIHSTGDVTGLESLLQGKLDDPGEGSSGDILKKTAAGHIWAPVESSSSRSIDLNTLPSETINIQSDAVVKDVGFEPNDPLSNATFSIAFTNLELFKTVLICLPKISESTNIQLPSTCDVISGQFSITHRNYLMVLVMSLTGSIRTIATISQSYINNE